MDGPGSVYRIHLKFNRVHPRDSRKIIPIVYSVLTNPLTADSYIYVQQQNLEE